MVKRSLRRASMNVHRVGPGAWSSPSRYISSLVRFLHSCARRNCPVMSKYRTFSHGHCARKFSAYLPAKGIFTATTLDMSESDGLNSREAGLCAFVTPDIESLIRFDLIAFSRIISSKRDICDSSMPIVRESGEDLLIPRTFRLADCSPRPKSM